MATIAIEVGIWGCSACLLRWTHQTQHSFYSDHLKAMRVKWVALMYDGMRLRLYADVGTLNKDMILFKMRYLCGILVMCEWQPFWLLCWEKDERLNQKKNAIIKYIQVAICFNKYLINALVIWRSRFYHKLFFFLMNPIIEQQRMNVCWL